MKKLLFTLALFAAAPAFSGNGLCQNSHLPAISKNDSIQAVRAKLLTSGFFPVYIEHPASVPECIRKTGFFEFSECLNSTAYKGCYAAWLTRAGDKILIAFPGYGRAPFLADCPPHMRR